MCTVTIIPLNETARSAHGRRSGDDARPPLVRLACNRDELRVRPAAFAPVVREFGPRTAIMPIDPVSDGTWIAVNDAGLAATLLNVNLGRAADDPGNQRKLSRGTLIPRLMECGTLIDAERVGDMTDPRMHPPFRLVIVDDRNIVAFHSDGVSLKRERGALGDRAHFFTSSGLGDQLVEGPRRELFDQMFAPEKDWISQQDAFHRHSWPERRHISVCMERGDARTVSHTLVEIGPHHVALTYYPDAPDRAQPLAPIVLARAGAGE